jgi:hypothetical protein
MKRSSVYRLRHKTDGVRSVCDTYRDRLFRVFQSDLEIGGCAMTGGAHGIIVEFASS